MTSADEVLLVVEHRLQPESSTHFIEWHITSQLRTLTADLQASFSESCAQVARESRHASPLFNMAMHIRDRLQDLPPPDVAASSSEPPSTTKKSTVSRVKRVLIWSHHLLAISKRKDIVAWSSELELAGLSKPGYIYISFQQAAQDLVSQKRAGTLV